MAQWNDDDDDRDHHLPPRRGIRRDRGGTSTFKIMLGVAGGIMLAGCLGVGGCITLAGIGVAKQQAKRDALAAEFKKDPLSVTPNQLMSAYKTNGVAADNMLKERWVRITGQVNKVSKDISNTIYVTFKSREDFEILSVQCFFDDKFSARVSALTPGQTITVIGRCAGKFGNVVIKDCEFTE